MKWQLPHIWTHTPFPKHRTTTAALFTFFISTHTASQDIFLPLNGFQRTSAFHSSTSWDFHLAKLITLSSSLHYHIVLHSKKKKRKKKPVPWCWGCGSAPVDDDIPIWMSQCQDSTGNYNFVWPWPQVPSVYPVLGRKPISANRASVSGITLQNVSKGQDGTCVDADEQQFN